MLCIKIQAHKKSEPTRKDGIILCNLWLMCIRISCSCLCNHFLWSLITYFPSFHNVQLFCCFFICLVWIMKVVLLFLSFCLDRSWCSMGGRPDSWNFYQRCVYCIFFLSFFLWIAAFFSSKNFMNFDIF